MTRRLEVTGNRKRAVSLQRLEEKGSSTYSEGRLFTTEERFPHSECKGLLTLALNLEGASESPGNLTVHLTGFYWPPAARREHICDWVYTRISLFSPASQRGTTTPPRLRPPFCPREGSGQMEKGVGARWGPRYLLLCWLSSHFLWEL